MAFDFSKLNFISKLDARSRVFVLFGGIIGAFVAIYFLSTYFFGGSAATGTSVVATAPQGLSSTPGGQATPEFVKAVKNADSMAVKQAEMSGTSAVPTLIGSGMKGGGMGSCTVLCSDDNIDTKATINEMMSKAKLQPGDASMLSALVDKDVPVAEFGAALDKLVKANKLSPEDARQLYEQYQKQHNNRAVQESAKMIDGYLQSGQIPLDAANKLLAAQKRGASLSEYSDLLQDMVKKGQISPELAKTLMDQYINQLSKEGTSRNLATLGQMAEKGEISRDAANEIGQLIQAGVPADRLKAKLDEMVKAGKLTPEAAKKIMDDYLASKSQPSQLSSVNSYLQQAEADAYQELVELQADKKISEDTAKQIAKKIEDKVDYATFSAFINQLVKQNQLTPEIAKLKLNDYQKISDLRNLANKLTQLQTNNASPQEYEEALKRAVAAGIITPEQGAKLLAEYQGLRNRPTLVSTPGASDAYKALQANVTNGAIAEAANASTSAASTNGATEVLSQAQIQAQKEAQERKEQRLQAIVASMDNQASQLIASWGPPNMVHKDRNRDSSATSGTGTTTSGGSASGTDKDKSASSDTTGSNAPPLIKAGTILFAVLDTTVNSDYPDSPVLATVVEGKFKGAKLLGRLQTTKGVSGQMDRIMLTFNLVNMDEWPKSKSMTGFGIDPDTARSALATNVNYHYMQRFGALMATSFLQGYGQAAMSSGGTQVSSAFGTSSTNPQLSPSSKMAVAFGQMAQAVGDATKNYTNRPPTVVVDSGVGLGILFMSDVT